MKTLFDTTTLHTTALRNRVWRSATWLGLASPTPQSFGQLPSGRGANEGFVTDSIIRTYEALAEGGSALLVTGLTSISATDARIGGECQFYDDRFVASHRRLIDAVHRHGARILLQTAMVDGPDIDCVNVGMRERVSADAPSTNAITHSNTNTIDDIVAAFGDAARRAEQAGYDGVQIHAAHFFYLSRFISPLFNHRTDRYGGANILPAILSDMRSKTSADFLITIKINSTDEYPGGMTEEDFIAVCKLLSQAGCLRPTSFAGKLPASQTTGIDAIEVSANGTSRQGIRAGVNEGSFLHAAARLADEVDVPVALVGGLRSLEFIDHVLNTTKIEYISLSRPLVREPALIRRWQQGDTRPSLCVSCNSCYRTAGHQCVFNTNCR